MNHQQLFQKELQIMLLNTLPTAGPSISKMAITTMATKTKIKAYSTNPWPSSCGINNIKIPPFYRFCLGNRYNLTIKNLWPLQYIVPQKLPVKGIG
jgi:hypothetical protein